MESLLNNYEKDDELELRVGYYRLGKFNSKITEHMFYYFLNYFSGKQLEFYYSLSNIYMYKPNLPQGKIKTIVDCNKQSTIQKKTKSIIDLQKSDIRIALSKETNIETLDMYKYNSIMKRRKRYTFTRDDCNFKIDMTKDKYTNYFIYQLEIEFKSKPTVNELYYVVKWLKRKINEYYSLYVKNT